MCTAEDNKVKLARQNARTRKIKNGGQHNLFQLITMLKLFSFLQCCEANYFQMYNKNYARARRVLLLFSDLIPYFFLELFHQQRFFCRISQEGEGRREREELWCIPRIWNKRNVRQRFWLIPGNLQKKLHFIVRTARCSVIEQSQNI